MLAFDEDSDTELLEKARNGNQRAAQALVLRRLPALLSMAERMLNDRAEAEDVAQETFERIWKRSGAWKGQAQLSTYMYKIALNLCRDRLRKPNHGSAALDQSAENIPDLSPIPETRLHAKQQAQKIRQAMAELPQRQRAAIILSHYSDVSNPDAADILGVSVAALESLLTRGRKQLRTLLLDQRAELMES